MVDVVALSSVGVEALAGAVGPVETQVRDRRRPGRVAEASPELIALMRGPTVSARVRVALYDAPGFMLQPAGRRGRGAGFLLRAGLVVTGIVAWCAGLIEMMCWAWG